MSTFGLWLRSQEMMQMVGELHHCMLADMEWLCPMGGPNYEVIREDMGGMCHGECMEQMCCHMAQMIQPECIKELMEGCPDELSDMLLEEIGGMAEMMMQVGAYCMENLFFFGIF